MPTRYDYFCDYQIKRFLFQVVRAFSGFQYLSGRRGDVEPQLKIVPCTMAKRNRQVAAIQRNLSENVVNTVPMISIDMTTLTFDEARVQNPNHVGSVRAYERKIDPLTGNYTNEKGNSITVERLMPRPFTMTCQIDIWTSTQDQKHQLMEQILQIIYPTFDIQNSDNALDWTAITVAHPKDITWSSISVPVGNDDQIDIATITLEIPIWLSPPAKIKRQKVIEQIITNINEAVLGDDGEILQGGRLAQEITTPDEHWIRIRGGEIQLLGPKSGTIDPDGSPYSWAELFFAYRKVLTPAETQLRIRFSTDEGSPEIIGTLQEGADDSHLDWQIDIDTLPSNTMAPVDAVIDPIRTVPGDHLPAAAQGQRYLLANDLPSNSVAWGLIGARIGAIIEYNQGAWSVAFSGLPSDDIEYVLNLSSGKQLRWIGTEWTMSIDGDYAPGFWRFI